MIRGKCRSYKDRNAVPLTSADCLIRRVLWLRRVALEHVISMCGLRHAKRVKTLRVRNFLQTVSTF